MDSVPIDSYEGFWTTAVQVAVVLALALVLEMRQLAKSWEISGVGARRFGTAWYFCGAVILAVAVALPLQVLQNGTYRPWTVFLVTTLLFAGIGLVIVGPALNLLVAVFSEHILWAAVKWPGSWTHKLRKANSESIAAIAGWTEVGLEHLEDIEQRKLELPRMIEEIDSNTRKTILLLKRPHLSEDTIRGFEDSLIEGMEIRERLVLLQAADRRNEKRIRKMIRKALRDWIDAEEAIEQASNVAAQQIEAEARHLRDLARGVEREWSNMREEQEQS